jgi:hypothetical protein
MFTVSGTGIHDIFTSRVLISVLIGSREIASEEYSNNRTSKVRP